MSRKLVFIDRSKKLKFFDQSKKLIFRDRSKGLIFEPVIEDNTILEFTLESILG